MVIRERRLRDVQDTIRQEGYQAAAFGRTLLACPYTPDSDSARLWMEGYNQYFADRA